MSDINDFIDNGINDERTLDEVIDEYLKLLKERKKIKRKLEKFSYLLNLNDENDNILSFYEKNLIYDLIKNGNFESIDSKVKQCSLALKFGYTFEDLREYLELKEQSDDINTRIRDILTQDITFERMEQKRESERCSLVGHCFIKIGKKVTCPYCGATMDDYSLTSSEVKFLTASLKRKKCLIENVGIIDVPLIKLIICRQDARRDMYKKSTMEEQYSSDLYDHTELKISLKKAHMMDMKVYEKGNVKVNNPKYLSGIERFNLIREIEETIDEIEKSDTRLKKMLLEECKTAYYEVLILSGIPISYLYEIESINLTGDIDCLAKAYGNLSDVNFRVASTYFNKNGSCDDAISYKCYTAIPELNQKVLEMKVRDSHE